MNMHQIRLTVLFALGTWGVLGLLGDVATNNYGNLVVVEEAQVLVDAVSHVILDVTSKDQIVAHFSIGSTTSHHSEDLMNQVINSRNLRNTLKQVEDVKQPAKAPQLFNIFFVDSHRSFYKIYERMTSDKFDYQGYFLIVLTELPKNYLQHVKLIFENLWEILIVNVNIIFESTSGEAQLFTYFPFTKNYCAEVHPVLWKSFKNGTFNSRNFFYPQKSGDLFNCPVKVVSFDCPLMTIVYKDDGNHIYSEIDGLILLMLAERMKFKINLVPEKILKWGSLHANGSRSGAFKKV